MSFFLVPIVASKQRRGPLSSHIEMFQQSNQPFDSNLVEIWKWLVRKNATEIGWLSFSHFSLPPRWYDGLANELSRGLHCSRRGHSKKFSTSWSKEYSWSKSVCTSSDGWHLPNSIWLSCLSKTSTTPTSASGTIPVANNDRKSTFCLIWVSVSQCIFLTICMRTSLSLHSSHTQYRVDYPGHDTSEHPREPAAIPKEEQKPYIPPMQKMDTLTVTQVT